MNAERVKQMAWEAGFDLAGIAPAGPAGRADELRAWIGRGDHAGMEWMARTLEERLDPRVRWPEARSLLVVGLSYHTVDPPPEYWDDPRRGRIARYAWGEDYHVAMRGRLAWLRERMGRDEGWTAAPPSFVDAAPVFERDVAERAGLGFAGRNTCLISRSFGSHLLLGGLVLPIELEPDPPVSEPGLGCGRCRRCLDACPTGALVAPHRLDARRCISFLTIEHRGDIAPELRPLMGRWLFGCDECQAVCPWVRRFSRSGQATFLHFDPEVHAPRLDWVVGLSEEEFHRRYRHTAVRRAKRQGLIRNARIAIENGRNPESGL